MKIIETSKLLLNEFEKRYKLEMSGLTQGSEEWLNLKLGVISASNVSKAIAKKGTATRDSYLYDLIGQVCTGYQEDISSKYMDWGKTNEDKARAYYEFRANCKLSETPFIFKDNTFRCGASPDALVHDKKGVEIKCPYNTTHHIAFAIDDKIKSEYKHQIQFTMWVADLETYDFCSYDPRMNTEPLVIRTLEKDPKAFATFDELIPEFIKDMDAGLEKLGIQFGQHWKNKAEKLKRAV